jgi:hypothetical protein
MYGIRALESCRARQYIRSICASSGNRLDVATTVSDADSRDHFAGS